MAGVKTICDENLVACCGLYCAACGMCRRGKCPGCAKNEKASWCGVRKCCLSRKFSSCADCPDFPEPADCKKLNNFISKLIGFFTRSDRPACVRRIKAVGRAQYAREMSASNSTAIKRKAA